MVVRPQDKTEQHNTEQMFAGYAGVWLKKKLVPTNVNAPDTSQ